MSLKSQVARATLLVTMAAAVLSSASTAAADIPDVTPPSKPASGSGDWPICGGERSSVTLKWKASVDEPGGSGLKGYDVDYDGREIFVAADAGETVLVTGLAPGSGRSVFVHAVDNAGNRSAALQIYRAIASCVPRAPTNLRVGAATSTSVALSWTAPLDDGLQIAEYNVYAGSVRVARTPGTTVLITGLTPDTMYSFAVEAVDANGLAGQKSSALAVLTPHNDYFDVTPPSTPGEGSGDWPFCGPERDSVNLQWGASVDEVGGSGLKGYEVDYDGRKIFVAADAGETLLVTGIEPGSGRDVYVTAIDKAGNRSALRQIYRPVPVCLPPTKPSDVKGVPTATTMALTWAPSAGANGLADSYHVYLNGAKVGSTPRSSYTLTGLLADTQYTVEIEAVSAGGLAGPKSDPLTVKTWVDVPPPGFRFGVAGTTTMRTLAAGKLPMNGAMAGTLNASTGAFSADLTFHPADGRLLVWSFLPLTAKFGFVQSGRTTGTLVDGVLTSNSKMRIKVLEVKLFGTVPLVAGNSCQTKQLSDINLKSVGEFSARAGGTIAGTFKLGDLNNCGVFNGLVSPLTTGGGNTISLTLSA